VDLWFWYDAGFGSPIARALGSGYVLELLSRLTGKRISHSSPLTANPSTFSINLTLDTNPTTFPLDQPIYVDATHDVVMVNIATALNLTTLFGEDVPPSGKKMRRGRRWLSSRIAPFAANMQLQRTCSSFSFRPAQFAFALQLLMASNVVLECPDPSLQTHSSAHMRVILNDAVVALTGVSGCPEQKDGLCPLDIFVNAQKKSIEGSDWDWTCYGNWTVPEGDAWRTLTGDPPAKP
jgi:Histidine phosphatase superfamily (branch 2)